MSELPAYEPTPPLSPKKPRRKPMKRRKVKKAAAEKPVAKKRRKRRIVKDIAPRPPYSRLELTPQILGVVKSLMAMDGSMRGLVIAMAQGLAK